MIATSILEGNLAVSKAKKKRERERETEGEREANKYASRHFLNHRTFKQPKCPLIGNGLKRVFPYIGWTRKL